MRTRVDEIEEFLICGDLNIKQNRVFIWFFRKQNNKQESKHDVRRQTYIKHSKIKQDTP